MLVVVVPDSGFVPFRIGDPGGGGPSTSSSLSVSTTSLSAGASGSGNGAAGLSSTGADVLAPLLIGLIAVLLGVFALAWGLRSPGRRGEPDR